MAGLALGFAQPLILLGLLSLPALWWLLRLMPPLSFDRREADLLLAALHEVLE